MKNSVLTLLCFINIYLIGYVPILSAATEKPIKQVAAGMQTQVTARTPRVSKSIDSDKDQKKKSCDIDTSKWPNDYVVYSGGAYRGRNMPHQPQIEVIVNSPNRPVALILSAYESSVWNIQQTKGTRILGIVITGYHTQKLSGIDKDADIHIVNSSGGQCGYTYIHSSKVTNMFKYSNDIFGRRPIKYNFAEKGKLTFVGKLTLQMPKSKHNKTQQKVIDSVKIQQKAIDSVTINAYRLRNMKPALRQNKQVVMAAVRKNGVVLEFASKKLRADKEVVLAAVKNNSKALKFADKSLKEDIDIVKIAVKNDRNSLGYIELTAKKKKVLLSQLNMENKPTYLDDSLWGQTRNPTRCIVPIMNNTKLVRASYMKLELLNEADLFLENTLTSDKLKYVSKCLVSKNNKYLFVATNDSVQMYDLNKFELYKTYSLNIEPIGDISFAKQRNKLNVLTRGGGTWTKTLSLYRLDLDTEKVKKAYENSTHRTMSRLEGDYLHVTELQEINLKEGYIFFEERNNKKYIYNIATKQKSSDDSVKGICRSEDGSKYLKKVKNKILRTYSYNIYHKNNQNALLQLNVSSISQCVIYGDTLILVDAGPNFKIKKISLSKKSLTESYRFYPLEVLPIIDKVQNNEIIISHYVSAFYGWDKKRGAMLWANVWDYLQRNHWDRAKYRMRMYENNALMKPYGWSGERINGEYRNDIMLNFNIKDGTFVYTTEPKQSGKLINEETKSYFDGRKNYFTINGVKFIGFESFEWLTISEDGYFNASSVNVLNNIYISDGGNQPSRRKLNQSEIKKWYRPDIISNLIQGKSLNRLLHQDTAFKLPPNSNIQNKYADSLVREYIENKNLSSNFKPSKKNIKLLKSLNLLDNAKTQLDYYFAYRALGRARALDEEGINRRIENITENSTEQPELIRFLYWKDKSVARSLIKDLYHNGALTDASGIVIAKMATSNGFRKPNALELKILWDAWDKQYYIKDKKTLELLSNIDNKRAQKYAAAAIVNLHKDLRKITFHRDCSLTEKNSFLKSIIEGNYSINILYDFLSASNIHVEIDELKKSVNKQVEKSLVDNENCIPWVDSLFTLQSKLNSKSEKL